LTSRTTRRFREVFLALPEEIRQRARQAYRRFREDPFHPSLRFRRVHATEPVYSARVGLRYRALALVQGDVAVWFWIGSHGDYDRLLERL
jgi:hypothetical protein